MSLGFPDNETINEVTISFASGFKEVKQVDFSFAFGVTPTSITPVPELRDLLLVGTGLASAGAGAKALVRTNVRIADVS